MTAAVHYTLNDLAARIGGEAVGDAGHRVSGLAHPDTAGPDDLALVIDRRGAEGLATTRARAAAVPAALRAKLPDPGLRAWLVVEHPRRALAGLTALFDPPSSLAPGIHPSASIGRGVEIGEGARIGAQVVIGDGARIGPGTHLHPQVTLGAEVVVGRDCRLCPGARVGDRVHVGDRVILHPNCVIGADGFSFVTETESTVEKAQDRRRVRRSTTEGRNAGLMRIASLGTVVLEDDVEVGACTTIDRGTLGETRVARGTKIDNLVMVAHNCRIGEDCLIAGQVGMSGSVVLGDRSVLAGQVGIADHKTLGSDCLLLAGSGVAGDVPDGAIYAGYPAMPREDKMRELGFLRRGPRLLDEVKALRARLEALESHLKATGAPDTSTGV